MVDWYGLRWAGWGPLWSAAPGKNTCDEQQNHFLKYHQHARVRFSQSGNNTRPRVPQTQTAGNNMVLTKTHHPQRAPILTNSSFRSSTRSSTATMPASPMCIVSWLMRLCNSATSRLSTSPLMAIANLPRVPQRRTKSSKSFTHSISGVTSTFSALDLWTCIFHKRERVGEGNGGGEGANHHPI